MASTDTRTTRLQFASLGTTTADDGYMSPPGPGVWRLDSVYLDPQAATTAHDTDYATVTAKKGSTALAARATTVAGGSLVAGTPAALTMSGTGTDLELTYGTHCLLIAITKAGSGVTIEAGITAAWTHIRT